MRDRFTEFLPLVLVVVILAGYHYLHGAAAPDLPMMAISALAPTPTPRPVTATALPLPAATQPLAPASAPPCAGSQPRFLGGMAMLRAAVGSQMGDAIECEHVVDAQGNTQQTTTTGLAYYLKASNLACFTTGYDHWTLRNGALVTWTGDSATPPQ